MKILLLLIFLIAFLYAEDGKTLKFEAMDTPNDKGESITINFGMELRHFPLISKAILFRKTGSEVDFKEIKDLDLFSPSYKDLEVQDDIDTWYMLKIFDKDKKELFKSEIVGPVKSEPQFFNKTKITVFILSILSCFLIYIFILIARTGKQLYIRPLSGIKAIEEAVGRATEMGKSIIYIPGISVIEDVATLASISILSKAAEIVAQYNSRLIIPNYDSIVYSVIDDVVKNAYLKVGRPDAYRAEDIYYLTGRQFAFASAVSGMMAREKPAANLFLGTFMAESLILAEAGSMTGAIQIAGTDSPSQIPFFVAACDYTLIGEELYAAGAYMGGNTQLLGGLKGQDYVKIILMTILVVLFLMKLFGYGDLVKLLIGG